MLPLPISFHKMLWKMLWGFEYVVSATVLIPAHKVERARFGCDMADYLL